MSKISATSARNHRKTTGAFTTRWLPRLVVAAALLASGCVHAHPPRHHRGQAKVVKIEKGHRHTHRCGHYQHRGHWYHLQGHVHGKKCGHVKVRGIWVIKG